MVKNEGPPEPSPDFNGTAQGTLDWLWPAHVYVFAILFIILALVTISALVVTRFKKNYVKTTMLCAIVTLSVSRSVMLFVDPYLSSGKTSTWWKFGYIFVTGFGTMSLTASLAIMLYVTTISTRVTSIYQRAYLGRVVCGATISNLVFFITSDIITIIFKEGKIMLTICQITFALWGIVIFLGFCGVIYKLRKNARSTFEQVNFNVNMNNEGHRLQKLSVLLSILSINAAIFFVLRIAEAISGLTSHEYSNAWLWLILQTALRILEIITCIVLLLLFKREISKNHGGCQSIYKSESEQNMCKEMVSAKLSTMSETPGHI